MTGAQLSEGLAAAARVRREALVALADEIAARADVDVVARPAAGSAMVELETGVGAFCLTEVVVTTAQVRVAQNEGFGAVMGWDAAGSLACALCDAAGGERAARLAGEALEAEAAERSERLRAVAATKV